MEGRHSLMLALDASCDARVTQLASDVQPLPGFDEAAAVVLAFLSSTFDLGLWMVTRTAGDDWIVLSSAGSTYPVSAGDVFRWSDSFCSRMVLGEGPRVAPDSEAVPAYAQAPIGRQVPIGSYVGVPLTGPDGELFGTLCAIDPAPRDGSLVDSQPLFELQARLLSSMLSIELTATREARRADVAEQRASTDALTGALNRGGWDALLLVEQERSNRHSSPVSVIVLDLDGLKACNDVSGHAAGDRLLTAAGRVLLNSVRTGDIVARTGGDEFAVLCPETPEAVAHMVATRLQERLKQAGIEASAGVASLDPRDPDLPAAWHRADQAMYTNKGIRRLR